MSTSHTPPAMDMGFCRVPDQVTGQAGARLYQWPIGHVVTWTVVNTIPRFSADDYKNAADECFKLWTDICGWQVKYVSNPAHANLLLGSRMIDGRMGVLGEAELPVGNVTPATQLRLWLDIGDTFAIADNPPPGTIPLLPVLAHEIGHNAGLGHNQDGVINALMDPTISHIKVPQAWDIEQMVLRYGERQVTPAPTGDDSDQQDVDLVVLLEAITNCVRVMTPRQQEAAARLLGQKFGSILNIAVSKTGDE